jgi:hypothetical protein
MVHAILIARHIDSLLPEIDMLGLFARWGHNVLLVTMAVLTLGIVLWAK